MKTVIITGANGNLGRAVTTKFLDKGYRVIATVINQEMTSDFVPHTNLKVEVANLSDEDNADNFVQSCIQEFKVIDAALLLVGGFAMGNIADTRGIDIKKQVALNFETAYYVARPVFNHFINSGNGRLVFIGARPALDPSQGKNMLAYSLSKSLLFKLAEYLNAEAKGKNITATVVVPSTIDTPGNRKSMPGTDPQNWVKPEDLAEILEFVISEKGTPLRETVLKVYNNA